MTRIARKSVKELADTIKTGNALQRKEIQFSLLDVGRELYLFLLYNDHGKPACFKTFPKDCCYFSTFFAALVLERLGYKTIVWVFGNRQSTGSHVWCECDGFSIDLTSGQYSDSSDAYLVYENTVDTDAFHSSYQVVDKGPFDDRFRHTAVYLDLLPMVDDFVAKIDEDPFYGVK